MDDQTLDRASRRTDVGPRWTDLLPQGLAPHDVVGPSEDTQGVSDGPTSVRTADVWTYHGPDGQPVGQARRFDKPDGSKDVVPYVPDGHGGWRKGGMPKPRPLYRLPTILAAPPSTPILVVEGEKCADAAHAMIPGEPGPISTTWAGGSNAVHHADWSPMAGRIVCVWPDADEAGDKAAQEVIAQSVHAGARAIWCLAVPEHWPKGHDVADLTPAEVEDVWTSGNLWTGGPVDAVKVRALVAKKEAAREAERLRRRQEAANRSQYSHNGQFPELDIDAARAISILEVARRLGIEHDKGWARCPFHPDKNPSLHLNPKKNAAFCNPCHKSWDGIALTMEIERLEFPAAVRWLLGQPEPMRRAS